LDSTRDRADVGIIWSTTIAVWFALLGGLVEVVILYVERRSNPLIRLSDDFVWMAPTALMAATLVANLCCAIPARIGGANIDLRCAPCRPSPPPQVLMLVPGLNHYAAALVASGVAVQAARLVPRYPAGIERLVRRSSPIIVGGLALVGLAVFLSSPRRTSRRPHRETAFVSPSTSNVVLITLDTVRAANLSLYGYSKRTTPRLDQLARRGVVFQKAFATAPWTLPSHASLFTGRWPHELTAGYTSALDGKYPTLAEYFLAHGYVTAGFAANLGYCSFESGLGRGFLHYEDYPRSLGQVASSSTLIRKVADNFTLRSLLKNDQHLNRVDAADLNARVLAWLATRPPSPFFLFINYFDAHEPYLPPPSSARLFGPPRKMGRYSPLHRWLWDVSMAHRPLTAAEIREEVDQYDAALAYLDARVGELLDELDRRQLLNDTLLVITADHGEEFGEHAVFDHGYSYRQRRAATDCGGRRRARDLRVTTWSACAIFGNHCGDRHPGSAAFRVSRSSLWPVSWERHAPPEFHLEVNRASGQPGGFPASKGDMRPSSRGFHYIRNGDGRGALRSGWRFAGRQRCRQSRRESHNCHRESRPLAKG
jgi:arylsulfatase A-like enzyme